MRPNKIIGLVLIFITLFSSCRKDSDQINNDGNTIDGTGTGTLIIKNQTAHAFNIYIDGDYAGRLGAYETLTNSDIPAGYYTYSVKQQTGYYEHPLEEYHSEFVYSGTNTRTTIPEITKGEIKIENPKSDPYYVYIDGELKATVAARSSQTFTVDAWRSYAVKVEQKSGYTFWATTQSWTVNVDANYIYTRTITSDTK